MNEEIRVKSYKQLQVANGVINENPVPVYKNLMQQDSIYRQEIIDKIGYISFTYGFIIRVR